VRRLGPFTPIDIATLLYLGAATIAVLVTYRGDVPGGGWLFVAHALVFVVVLLAPRARAAGPVGRFLGEWYPMALLAALYGEIGVLTVGAGLQNDWWIQRLEMWVFGSEVSYNWIREMPNVAFSWVLHLCYLAYYPILYASPLGLWLIGRREAARDTIFAVMVTSATSRSCFSQWPARATPSTSPTTPPRMSRRHAGRNGCSIAGTPGARPSPPPMSPPRSWPWAWPCGTTDPWGSCCSRSPSGCCCRSSTDSSTTASTR
jgi:hypothetical protein